MQVRVEPEHEGAGGLVVDHPRREEGAVRLRGPVVQREAAEGPGLEVGARVDDQLGEEQRRAGSHAAAVAVVLADHVEEPVHGDDVAAVAVDDVAARVQA